MITDRLKPQLKTTYRAIQGYQETSGVHWDTPENEGDVGRGANVVSDAEGQVWDAMIKSKVRCKQNIIITTQKTDRFPFLLRKITR
jgi:hypothetical protein